MSDEAEAAPERGQYDFVDGKMSFPLRRPIQAHGAEVKALALREPAGGDLIALGNPVDTFSDAEGGLAFRPDATKMARYIERLGNIPPSSVASIHIKDLSLLNMLLAPFFTPV